MRPAPAALALATPIFAATLATTANAQTAPTPMMMTDDNPFLTHIVIDQAEARIGTTGTEFRYDAQAWAGTDTDKLWLKSEGLLTQQDTLTDGQHEILYDRPVSTYFDLQAGLRVDLDRGPTRSWAAIGLQGLAAYFINVEATAYASDRARYAARLKAATDLPITNRLILQPAAEANLYTRPDPQRATRTLLSEIDTGLRLRYEFTRKFAPYVGLSYAGALQHLETRFSIGLRTWF